MKLKEIKERRNLTFDDLVTITGVPKRTLEDIVKRGDCRVSTAIQIANSLGLTIDQLCTNVNTHQFQTYEEYCCGKKDTNLKLKEVEQIYNFLTAPEQILVLTKTSDLGKPALYFLGETLAANYGNYFSQKHTGPTIGRIVTYIMGVLSYEPSVKGLGTKQVNTQLPTYELGCMLAYCKIYKKKASL